MGSLASFIVFITVAVGFNLTKGLYEEGEQNLKKKSANKEFQDAIYHHKVFLILLSHLKFYF